MRQPKQETKTVLSYLNHWGASAWSRPPSTVPSEGLHAFPIFGGGLALTVGLWGFAIELAVPLLGLSEGPTASPPELHAHTLGAHIAYGLASAATIQVLEKAI